MKFKQAHSFDDVLLVPSKSSIGSRQEIDLTTSLGNSSFRLPIISSPMDTVTELEMMLTLLHHGGLGIVHRYNSISQQANMCAIARDRLEESSGNAANISAALGVSSDIEDRSTSLYDAGARIFCIDIAHGHHVYMERAIKTLRDIFGESITIIAGNIATPEAYRDLSDWGADAVRIGIGGGSICSTRIQTGHGMPTFQSVLDCSREDGAAIVADGGIKTAGDIVKALAAGADMVMLGSLLAGTDESPGDVFASADGRKYKVYRGMASVEAQVDWRGHARSLEGITTTIPYKGSVKNILKNLEQNIKSGLSYTGARTISEFQASARFIQQTNAGQLESGTHILNR
jgi:IMP dehydrogenase